MTSAWASATAGTVAAALCTACGLKYFLRAFPKYRLLIGFTYFVCVMVTMPFYALVIGNGLYRWMEGP